MYEYMIVLKVRELKRPDLTDADKGINIKPGNQY